MFSYNREKNRISVYGDQSLGVSEGSLDFTLYIMQIWFCVTFSSFPARI